MTNYYECHITILGNKEEVKSSVEKIGWIFSCIDGDIILGEGIKCYATMHYSSTRFTLKDIKNKVIYNADLLKKSNLNILREKVELVVYDTKQK